MRKFASFLGSENLTVLVDPTEVACLSGMYLNNDVSDVMTMIIMKHGAGAVPVHGAPDDVLTSLTEAMRLN